MVFHFFGLPGSASLADLEQEGRRHCAREWGPLQAARGAELQMDQYCFRCRCAHACLQLHFACATWLLCQAWGPLAAGLLYSMLE